MAIGVGDQIPDVGLKIMGPKGPEDISTSEIFGGKKSFCLLSQVPSRPHALRHICRASLPQRTKSKQKA